MKATTCLIIFVSILSICLIESKKFSFRNHRLIRANPKSAQSVQLIKNWEETDNEFDVWKASSEGVDVLLSPSAFLKFKRLFNKNRIAFDILDSNIQEKIDEQIRSIELSRNGDSKNIVGTYARYSEIVNYLDNIVAANPDLASVYTPGFSHENRALKTLVLKTATSTKGVWLDCGIHAREWVATASCIWIIDRLISEYRSGDAVTKRLLDNFEIHIMPLVNPDGYEYSHTTYRLWRKNRRPNTGSSCIGTDLNRNFGYKWLTGGSSTNPCSDTFAGPSADSEPETKVLEKAILDRNQNGFWTTYLTIHTYGLWFFTPWGYTSTLPDDYNELYAKAKIGTDAIKAYSGTTFEIGSSAALLYINSGPSDDWARGTAGIKHSYTLELAPGQKGPDSNYGFTLPADRMPKVGEETWRGIKAFLNSFL